MCGFGYVFFRDGNSIGDLNEWSQDTISLRGSDECFTKTTSDSKFIFFRHQVNLTPGGNQPFSIPGSESITCMFNGEIYNQRELCAHYFPGEFLSEVEVICRLYQKFGESSFSLLSGMFAILIEDRDAGCTIASIDGFGIKPLYFFDKEKSFGFASDSRFLCKVNNEYRPDENTLSYYALTHHLPPGRSMYEGVKCLVPGQILKIFHKQSSSISSQYLSQQTPTSSNEFSERLNESIAAHVSDMPAGIFLSGGVDSIILLEQLTRVAASGLYAYHLALPGREEETSVAKTVCKKLQVPFIEVAPSAQQIEEAEQFLAGACDQPFGDTGAISTSILSQEMSKKGLKVAYSAAGADEIFAGYSRYLLTNKKGLYSYLKRLNFLPIKFYRLFAPQLIDYLSQISGASRYDEKKSLNVAIEALVKSGSLVDGKLFSQNKVEFAKGRLHLDRKFYLPQNILRIADSVSMAHKIEVRVPFVDSRLADIAFFNTEKLIVGEAPRYR